MSTTGKINRLVRRALPKGKPAKIMWLPTGFSQSRILRVVTPAWRTLPRSQRIYKLQRALEADLTAREQQRIFRISVLTPAEFERLAQVVPRKFLTGSGSSNGRGITA
jgi:hypothetical protein